MDIDQIKKIDEEEVEEDEMEGQKNFESSELTCIENSAIPNELTESGSYLDISKHQQ